MGWKRIMLSPKRVLLYLLLTASVLFVIDVTGLLKHLYEQSFDRDFSYPLEIHNFKQTILKFRNNEDIAFKPINDAASRIAIKFKADEGCSKNSYRMVILVKTRLENFEQRQAIRDTWGYTRRFSDVPIKTVFLMGEDPSVSEDVSEKVLEESLTYGDIVFGSFLDNPKNSTVKLLMGLRWLAEICPQYRFALIVNDDMYVSIKNLLKFVRHPVEYPIYWEKQKALDNLRNMKMYKKRRPRSILNRSKSKDLLSHLQFDKEDKEEDMNGKSKVKNKPTRAWKNSPVDFDIDLSEEALLYAGNVMYGPTHRNKGSKYYLTIEEYPFDEFPPFVTSEAIALSKAAVEELYYATFFTKYIEMDDLYLGLCSKKMEIEPFHSVHFKLDFSYRHNPYGNKDFRYIVTANNFNDPEGLRRFWNGQKALGNA